MLALNAVMTDEDVESVAVNIAVICAAPAADALNAGMDVIRSVLIVEMLPMENLLLQKAHLIIRA
jgi:hypothetical protein